MHNEKGQTLIELALAVFLLFMVLFGITEFGSYFFQRNTLNSAARAGVRQAVVRPNLSANSGVLCPGAADTIERYICDTLVGSLSATDLSSTTVTVSIYVGTTAALRGGNAVAGDRVQIRVSRTFQILTGTIIPFFSGSRNMAGEASMRYEL